MADPFYGINSVLLFGSRARGDHERGSDTDLLMITSSGSPKHKSIGHLSMFFYPWCKLLSDATEGDLFVCHVAMEGKSIFDPSHRLDKLRANIRVKASYDREVSWASDLGWLLDRHADALAPGMVAKRMLWCVRTILIARTAEQGQPEFSPAKLAIASPSRAVSELLLERHQRRTDALMRRRFRAFLASDAKAPPLAHDATTDEFLDLFLRTGNEVGLRTLRGRHAPDAAYF